MKYNDSNRTSSRLGVRRQVFLLSTRVSSLIRALELVNIGLVRKGMFWGTEGEKGQHLGDTDFDFKRCPFCCNIV